MNSKIDIDQYIHLTQQDAIKKIEESGLLWRIKSMNGVSIPASSSYCETRLNLEIQDDIVKMIEIY
jgi:hypothetical protein